MQSITYAYRYASLMICFFSIIFFVWYIGIVDVYGQTFQVGMTVGGDVLPPTVPTALSGLPISDSEINLSWNASTDDWGVAGYQVWRNGVVVATTTATAYIDTGLSASTTYTYYVVAFDSIPHMSASSSIISVGTLDISVQPSSSGNIQGTRLVPFAEMLSLLSVHPEQQSVFIHYETNGYVKGLVRIGETSSYEIGVSAENTYRNVHEVHISDLKADTLYYISIEGETSGGRRGRIYTGTFQTLAHDDVFPPSNVTDIHASQDHDGMLVLTWKNPVDTDLAKIRVIRNDTFYPSDSSDGYVVFDGVAEEARDTQVYFEGETRYYSIFAYDTKGNISSGSVIAFRMVSDKNNISHTEPLYPIFDPSRNDVALRLGEIQFFQDHIPITVVHESVHIDSSKPLTISIPYTKLPEHLKTILVVIKESTHVDAKSFSFLLRVNEQKTAFEGIIAPFGIEGTFPIQISIFDYKTQQIGYTQGNLEGSLMVPEFVGSLHSSQSVFLKKMFMLGIIIFILVLLTLYARRGVERNRYKNQKIQSPIVPVRG